MNSHYLRSTLFTLSTIAMIMILIVSCDKKDDDISEPKEFTLDFSKFTIIEDACDKSYTQDNVTLTLMSSYMQEGDCAYYAEDCAFETDNDNLWIAWGRAVLDVSKLGTIQKISVTIVDYGHTQIVLYDAQGERIAVKENTVSSEPETITFDTNLDNVYSIAVSGCECLVDDVTIDYKP